MSSVLPVRQFPMRRAATALASIVARCGRRLMLWRARQALLALDDRMLHDIGLSREDIEIGQFPTER
jgi:uncharacterized protein YjiS (DUF1127 family)